MQHFSEALIKFDRNGFGMIISIMHKKTLEHKRTHYLKENMNVLIRAEFLTGCNFRISYCNQSSSTTKTILFAWVIDSIVAVPKLTFRHN
jgi:hypothetical protein